MGLIVIVKSIYVAPFKNVVDALHTWPGRSEGDRLSCSLSSVCVCVCVCLAVCLSVCIFILTVCHSWAIVPVVLIT